MKKSTITDLSKEIEALIPANERTHLINKILLEARQGEFHDFKSEKYVCEKIELVNMLRETGDQRLNPLIWDVIHGVYDEPPTEKDSEKIRQMLIDQAVPLSLVNAICKQK